MPDDFYEDDEPVEDVLAAFERGEKGKTVVPVGWYCEHMTMTAGGGLIRNPVLGCGCRMSPIFPDQLTSA